MLHRAEPCPAPVRACNLTSYSSNKKTEAGGGPKPIRIFCSCSSNEIVPENPSLASVLIGGKARWEAYGFYCLGKSALANSRSQSAPEAGAWCRQRLVQAPCHSSGLVFQSETVAKRVLWLLRALKLHSDRVQQNSLCTPGWPQIQDLQALTSRVALRVVEHLCPPHPEECCHSDWTPTNIREF